MNIQINGGGVDWVDNVGITVFDENFSYSPHYHFRAAPAFGIIKDTD